MTGLGILTGPQLQLPTERQDDDFELFARDLLNGFLGAVGGMSGQDLLAASIKAELPKMIALCDALRGVLHTYFHGNTYEAYQGFVNALQPVLGDLKSLMSGPAGVQSPHVMYRMRQCSMQQIQAPEIFHLPFQLRHEATMKRYSVPGVPMLYLGGSVYICWEEMGRPPFDDIQLSAFWTQDGVSLQLLDFGYRPSWLGTFVHDPNGMSHKMRDFITAYCVCWPLIALCSIKAKRQDKPFVPEYVMPQMVLQWLTVTKEFDGVRYFSCHVDRDTDAPRHMCNYVFPPKQYPATGQCPDLQGMFAWTPPLPWQMLNAARAPAIDTRCYAAFKFALYTGAVNNYRHTSFGEVQARVNQLVVHDHPGILNRQYQF